MLSYGLADEVKVMPRSVTDDGPDEYWLMFPVRSSWRPDEA